MKKDNGGSAFPVSDSTRAETDYGRADYGMTLRDWFAGQALAGSPCDFDVRSYQGTAEYCYYIADAMIAERDKE